LHIAVSNGYTEAAKILINKDPQLINTTDRLHWYPLHLAAWEGHCDIVSILLKNGADVNSLAKNSTDNLTTKPSVSALQLATKHGHLECVQILLNNKVDIDHKDHRGDSALQIATDYGKNEIVRLLIAAGANPSSLTNKGKIFYA
jgi:ankyrin repeat protein